MEHEQLETLEGHDVPTIRQISVFTANRVGQLLRLTQLLDNTEVRILALSVVHSFDCAICRMIVDDPDEATEALAGARVPLSESELLVVSVPHGKHGLLHIWAALIGAEVNINYTYPLMTRPLGHAAIAVYPDNIDQATRVLRERAFYLLSEQDLLSDRNQP